MALTCVDIGEAIYNALGNSTAILSKCDSLFGAIPTIYYGSTGRKAPPPEDFPAFVVISWGKERGEDESNRIFNFTVGLTVHDENLTIETNEYGVKMVKYRGPKSLEELLDLAMTEIRGISNELYFDDKNFDFEPIEYFPLFYGELTLTISYPILIGGYEPTL